MVRGPHTIRGFTLIELLVVVSVIALLLSITMPSLVRAKRQAESVVCQSNLRQMMVAAVLYTDSYNGFFPVAYYTQQTDAATVHYNWDFTVRYPGEFEPAPALDGLASDGSDRSVPTVEPGLLWQGDPIEKIQQCPSFRGESNTPYDPYTGYNYNTSYIGGGQYETIPDPSRRDRLMQPAQTAVFGDGQSLNGANKFMRAPFRSEGDLSFSGRYAGAQGFRHNLRTNVGRGDGSVSSHAEVYTAIDPARHQAILDEYNRHHPRCPVGFLSPDNSAYKIR